MDNYTLALNCNHTTHGYAHYVYSTLSYLVFIGNAPGYPNCENCIYDITFNSTSMLNISNNYFHIANATLGAPEYPEQPVTLSVIGEESPWVAWLAVHTPDKNYTEDANTARAVMRVLDPFNISWCAVYNVQSVDPTDTQDISNCTEVSEELPVNNQKSSIHLNTYFLNSTFTVSVSLNASNISSQCSGNVSLENMTSNVHIPCPTLPLTVSVKASTDNMQTGAAVNASIDIGWLLQNLTDASLTVSSSPGNLTQKNCTTYKNISKTDRHVRDENLYVLAQIPALEGHKDSFTLTRSPILLNFSRNSSEFQLVLYDRNSSCVWANPANGTDTILVSMSCPHITATISPRGEIKVNVTGNFSRNANLSLAFLSSKGKEYAGVLLQAFEPSTRPPPGTVAPGILSTTANFETSTNKSSPTYTPTPAKLSTPPGLTNTLLLTAGEHNSGIGSTLEPLTTVSVQVLQTPSSPTRDTSTLVIKLTTVPQDHKTVSPSLVTPGRTSTLPIVSMTHFSREGSSPKPQTTAAKTSSEASLPPLLTTTPTPTNTEKSQSTFASSTVSVDTTFTGDDVNTVGTMSPSITQTLPITPTSGRQYIVVGCCTLNRRSGNLFFFFLFVAAHRESGHNTSMPNPHHNSVKPEDHPHHPEGDHPDADHHERFQIWLLPIAGTIFALVALVIVNIALCMTE
ncbi:envelope glycoprotein 350 [Alcelaphine gammaherpesvirus 1]|nr:envelope glycoprotein 350 [Alcelaphine gammaherpesvirus 1]APB09572.1 envelope glycoprotein 350 [Alcelaphine gammaherpesvirus 1]